MNQDSLRINRAQRRFLGVCAGLADYLDVPVVLVRVIFVVSVLTWPTLIIGYFLLYFCLDNNITTEKVQEFFSSGAGSEHFRKLDYRRPIYRNMNNRRIAGVCSGIADYLEVSAFWVRAVAVMMSLILGPYAILAYVIGWFVMEPNVVTPRTGRRERKLARFASRQARRAQRHQRRAERHMRKAQQYIHAGRLSDDYLGEASASGATATGKSNVRYNSDTVSAVGSRDTEAPANRVSLDACAELYYNMENRLREIEAYITSKRFRLHCEINRA